MMKRRKVVKKRILSGRFALITGILLLAAGLAAAAGKTAEEIMKEAHLNMYYSATDGRALVNMELTDKRGKVRKRSFVMLRLDIEDGGEQKYYTYCTEPGDVRRTGFMVWKDPAADDARWIYIPALDLVKRISAKDKGSSFMGSDFTYEDVSGRHWSDDLHELLREEVVGGRDCFGVQSVPKEADDFARKVTWVSKDWMLAEKEEYYDKKGKLFRIFRADEVKEIGGIPTVTRRSVENAKKKSSTVIYFVDVEYDVGLEEKLFTERYLKAPPKKYISN